MIELEILKLWIVPQQGKKHSEIDEEPRSLIAINALAASTRNTEARG